MSKRVSHKNIDKNIDRFIQLGIVISTLRKIKGMSQEQLAAEANISRSLLGMIEAPNVAHCFSLEVFFDLADALDISPTDLIEASVFPDKIINKNKEKTQK